MSTPKEKLIIQEIKEILKTTSSDPKTLLWAIAAIVNNYVDPGYIGGPVIGENEEE